MQIRNADEWDLPDLYFMFGHEYRETKARNAKILFKPADVYLKFIYILKNPQFGILLVAEDEDRVVGYIYGPYRKGWDGDDSLIIWHEVGWYVKPTHRKKGIGLALYQEAERLVRTQKQATHITVTAAIGSDHEHLTTKFEEAGFTPLQINFWKRLGEE